MILTNIEKKLGNFSLSIKRLVISAPGIYGLIGPNGSGKSTLAKIMAGILETDRGSIDTEGLKERDITFLGRKPYMMEDTVYNNLVYPLRLRNIKPDPELTESFLGRMGFSQKGKQRARSLSGGEQQKLAFLRSIIFKPRLVIADEAMTAMDLESLDLFESILLEEQKRENSVWVIISHQMPHIRRICNSIIFLYNGKVETEGSAQDIFSEASSPRIAQYLRSYDG